jgi:hypothetical protein
MSIYTIDQKKVVVTFGNAILKGFQDGDTISLTTNADIWDIKVGLDGYTTRTAKNDNSAMVTCNLKQVAVVNSLLTSYYQFDKTSGQGVFPFTITDLLGGLSVVSGAAFIKKLPDITYSASEPILGWQFFLDDAVINFTGGIISL